MSNNIVYRNGDELFTTSEVIAKQANVSHASVIRLIDTYQNDLEDFGLVGFQIVPRLEGQHGGADKRIARLNEQQSTLLLSYMRNNEVVRKFKRDLVKGFFEMAQHIKELEQQPEQTAELTKSDLARMVLESEAEKEALEAQAKIDTPKAEAYDTFIGSDGTYSVGNVAKMLGTSQNKLFTELRNHGVLIGKGHMRNTPYQQYMHHFTVKAYSYTRSDGNEGTSYTTRVQPSGVDFIRKKLDVKEEVSA